MILDHLIKESTAESLKTGISPAVAEMIKKRKLELGYAS
jgi:hypothetical protein